MKKSCMDNVFGRIICAVMNLAFRIERKFLSLSYEPKPFISWLNNMAATTATNKEAFGTISPIFMFWFMVPFATIIACVGCRLFWTYDRYTKVVYWKISHLNMAWVYNLLGGVDNYYTIYTTAILIVVVVSIVCIACDIVCCAAIVNMIAYIRNKNELERIYAE